MQQKLITAILLLHLSIFSYAQEILDLSLQDAFNLAIKNSKQIQIDSLKKQAIDYKKQQVKSSILPSIGISSSYIRLSDNIEPFSVELPGVGGFSINTNIPNQFINVGSIKQPIFQGLKNLQTLKALDQQLLASDFDIIKDQENIKLLVVQYYYNLYILQQKSILLDSSIAQTQARIDDLTRLKDVGILLNNDVMRASLQKTNLQVDKVNTESNIETLNFNLAIILGLDVDTKIKTEAPNSISLPIDMNNHFIQNAFTNRPEIKAQSFLSKAADHQIKASKASYMPLLSLVANGQYNNPNQRMFPPKSIFKATWDVGISLNWNIMQLYSGRAIVKEAKNQKAQLDIYTNQLKDNISSEINANYQALKVAQSKIELAEQAIEQATENKRILDNRFNAQVALITDVLDADVFLLQAKINLLNAKADAGIANFKLQKSLGIIN